MKSKTRDVDLYAQFLGLERTLEDDILDLMEDYVKDTADSVIGEIIKDKGNIKQRDEIKQYIRDIVYEVLKEVFGETLIKNKSGSKAFKEQLFWLLETNGFERNCRGCYYQVKNYGKIEHGKL